MKKLITAIEDPIFHKNLKERSTVSIWKEDILYPEAILEILQKERTIDGILLNTKILPKEEILFFIKQIQEFNKKIEIIVIIEKQNKLEGRLREIGIEKIFYEETVQIEDILLITENKKNEIEEDLKEQIRDLKELILKKENKKTKKQRQNLLKRHKKEITYPQTIMSIIGTGGVGKSIVTINLANELKSYCKKILLIDFDILNSSLHTILGISKYSKKVKNKMKNIIPITEIQRISNINLLLDTLTIKDFVIKVNKKIDLLSGIDILFNSKRRIEPPKIEKLLQELKKTYDVILIDTSCECFYEYNKTLIECSNKAILITEANVSEIKKSKRLLEIYTKEWKIPKNKINILFNKTNSNSIEKRILQTIFEDFLIIGFIQFQKRYTLLINKNMNRTWLNKKIKKEYQKIGEKITKESKNKNLIKLLKNRILLKKEEKCGVRY